MKQTFLKLKGPSVICYYILKKLGNTEETYLLEKNGQLKNTGAYIFNDATQ